MLRGNLCVALCSNSSADDVLLVLSLMANRKLDYLQLCKTQIEGILPSENIAFVWSYLLYDDMVVII